MKKVFVSVPMEGRTVDEIKESIDKMHKIAEIYEGEQLELIQLYIDPTPPEDTNQEIFIIGDRIKCLAAADIFVCLDDIFYFKDCYIEREIAHEYGIKTYILNARSIIPNFNSLINTIESEKITRPPKLTSN